jgi:hypothetical protein
MGSEFEWGWAARRCCSLSVVASPGTGPEGVLDVQGWEVNLSEDGLREDAVACQSWHPLAQGQRACLMRKDGK